jgi:hypothetical protein
MTSTVVCSSCLNRAARVGAQRELCSCTHTGMRPARRSKHNPHVVPHSRHDMRRTSTSRRQSTGSPEPLTIIQSP